MRNKLLAITLALVMVLCMLPTVALAAGTAIAVSADADASGNGWNWDHASKTLTLYGVDISVSTNALELPDGSTIEVIGYNKLTSTSATNTLYCSGSLTIKGSGVLSVEATTGKAISTVSALTLDCGYIRASSTSSGAINAKTLNVNGGVIYANASSEVIKVDGDYSQTAGYVKITGKNGLMGMQSATISGGYLDIESSNDGTAIMLYYSKSLTNNGGVIKASGGKYAISDIVGNTCTVNFNSGVSILSGTTKAVDAKTVATNGAALYWDNTSGTVSGEGTVITGVNGSGIKSVVIAKSVATSTVTGAALDSAYIKVSEGNGFTANAATSITGGSYIESSTTSTVNKVITFYGQSVNGNGTVVANTNNEIDAIDLNGSKVSDTPKFIGISKAYGINVGLQSGENCNFIGIGTGSKSGLTISHIVPGYKVIGVSTSGSGINVYGSSSISGGEITGYSTNGTGIEVTKSCTLNNANASITGVSANGTAAGISLASSSTITNGVIGAYGASTGAVTGSPTTTGMSIKSATALSGVFGETGLAKPVVYIAKSAVVTPNITVAKAGDGDDTAVYGATPVEKTYTATFANFTNPTNKTVVWCNADGTTTGTPAEAGTGLTITGTSMTFTTSATANAIDYYYKVGAKENNAGEMVYSPATKFTISKATKTATANFTVSTAGVTDTTYDLTSLIAAGGTATTGSATVADNTFITATNVADKALTYTAAAKAAGTSSTITIPVTGCTNYENYNIVLTVTSAAVPIFNDRFGGNATKDNYAPATYENAYAKGQSYTLEGWYDGIDGSGTKLTVAPENGKTYHAHWKKDGKTVITQPIDLSDKSTTLDNLATQGWKWTPKTDYDDGVITEDNNSGTLELSGAVIDCSNVSNSYYAVQIPVGAIIKLASGTTSTLRGGVGDYEGDTRASSAIEVFGGNNICILGNGTLNAYSENVETDKQIAESVAIYGNAYIGSETDSPTITAIAGTAKSTYMTDDASAESMGIYGAYIINGNITAKGNTATSNDYTASYGIGESIMAGGSLYASGIDYAVILAEPEGATITGSETANAAQSALTAARFQSGIVMMGATGETPAKTAYITFKPATPPAGIAGIPIDEVTTTKGTVAGQSGSGVVNASKLNVRAAAGTDKAILGKLERGAKVEILSAEQNWAKIKYGDGVGYVDMNYLWQINIATPITIKGSVLCRNLNVRDAASLQGKLVGKLHRGDAVTLDLIKDDWGRLDNTHGALSGKWINIKYIDFGSISLKAN